MPQFLPDSVRPATRLMLFVDGENLAIRYKCALGGETPPSHVRLEPDVWVWSSYLQIHNRRAEVIRQYYFTSVAGDVDRRKSVEDALRAEGIQAPRVFSKQKGRHTKQVDISLATEVLTHAHRGNYDVAVLVAGDSDYVPLGVNATCR